MERRVIRRFIGASLATDFESKFEALLAATPNPTPKDIEDFRKWVTNNFNWSRAPREAKNAKERLDHFWRSLESFERGGFIPGAFAMMKGGRVWDQEKEMIPTWVRFFSTEGTGKTVTRERVVGANTYINLVGASDKSLDGMISTIEEAFHSLKGWRRQALIGGVTTVFAGPKDFRGTSSGRYNVQHDRLWIRATAGGRIDKAGDGYGSLRYVIVHELGHRYEHKKGVPYDFQRPEWYTTRYSTAEGMSGASEAFAELFAISNFDIKGNWDQTKVDRFEKLMGGV
jgi:hypothetical protein